MQVTGQVALQPAAAPPTPPVPPVPSAPAVVPQPPAPQPVAQQPVAGPSTALVLGKFGLKLIQTRFKPNPNHLRWFGLGKSQLV